MLNYVLYYIAENFAILFVVAGFIYFLATQRESSAGFEKKYYWMMVACSIILLVAVPLEQWAAEDIKYRELRIILSVIAYWTRPAALMFLIFSCLEKSHKRLLIIIPEAVNVIIMGMALFSDFPFGYNKVTYGFIRHPLGYTSHIVGLIYTLILVIISLSKVKQGHKIESGILFIGVIGSSVAVFYSMVSAYELVSFSIAISGFFHYLFIRSQKHYEELNDQIIELTKAQQAANEANMAKTRFLFNMSHDIRTPMNAIVGFSDILDKNVNDPSKVKECTQKIRFSGNYLLSLINEMLEMARIESGKLELNEAAHNLRGITDSIHAVFETQLEEKKLNFVTNSNLQNEYVYCDATKVFEILFNIISNSIKYTPKGGTITASLTESPSDNEGYVDYKFVISDTGIGISEEFLPHVFDEFSREHNSTESKVGGTGLGMPIVKKLVDLMGGTISIESKRHHGTAVTVALQFRKAQEMPEQELITADDSVYENIDCNNRILLVEDNDLNAEIAITLLEDEGFDVTRATNGIECIKTLNTVPAGYYSIILMDIQMPGLNGYDTAKQIRKFTDDRIASVPIIAMTANAFEEDRNEALRAGMNNYISKPVNIKELKAMICRYISTLT